MNNRHGFTLVELMVVTAVIGTLAAISIPRYTTMQIHAREASVKGQAHAVVLAAEAFAAENGGIYSDAGGDLMSHLPGDLLMRNAFTGQRTEPRFQAAATTPGEIGITVVVEGGVNVGYAVNGWGKEEEIIVHLVEP